MSYLWIVRFFVLMLTHFVTSFALIYHSKKKISYFTEIFLSIFAIAYAYYLVPIILERNSIKLVEYIYQDYSFTRDKFLLYILEYVIFKIILLIVIWVLKYFSFFAIISVSKRNGFIANLGYKIFGKKRFIQFVSRMWYRVNYGIRVKKGMPERVRKYHKGIYFDRKGFPIFSAIETVKLKRRWHNKKRETHFYHCNKILYERIKKYRDVSAKFTKAEIKCFKEGNTPENYTWHHHQKRGVMQLVDRKIHESVNHRGGYAIWGKKED